MVANSPDLLLKVLERYLPLVLIPLLLITLRSESPYWPALSSPVGASSGSRALISSAPSSEEAPPVSRLSLLSGKSPAERNWNPATHHILAITLGAIFIIVD